MSEISRLYDEMKRAAGIVDVPRLPTTKMVEMHISDVLHKDLTAILPVGVFPSDVEIKSEIQGDKVVFTARFEVVSNGLEISAVERMKEAIDGHQ